MGALRKLKIVPHVNDGVIWFLCSNETIMGPYQSSEIITGIETSKFSPQMFCWREGFKEWRPIYAVQSFSTYCDFKNTEVFPKVMAPVKESASINYPYQWPPLKIPKRKIVRVRLGGEKKSVFSLRLLSFVFLFAVSFSYLTVYIALGDIQNASNIIYQRQELGLIESLGYLEQDPLPEYATAPIKASVVSNPALVPISMMAKIEGSAQEGFFASGYKLTHQSQSGLAAVEAIQNLGSEFQKYFYINGELNTANREIKIKHVGSPIIR